MVKAVALAVLQSPRSSALDCRPGIMREPLEALTSELGITDNVTFWGERLDVARFFSAADVYTMSSVSEGLPMSLLQAMSVGFPALVTNVGGMAESYATLTAVSILRSGDSAAMAEAIVQLASNSDRGRLCSNAKVAYDEHFTLEHMASAYMALYRKPRKSRP